jgi:3D (Asp-Asp-Asp) domain-containing protein
LRLSTTACGRGATSTAHHGLRGNRLLSRHDNGVGRPRRRGFVAADPAVLPLGSVIRVGQSGRYDGVYTVMDTGPKVRGRHVDLFIESCAAAKVFGRRTVRVSILDQAQD